jgi:hypothetical protein
LGGDHADQAHRIIANGLFAGAARFDQEMRFKTERRQQGDPDEKQKPCDQCVHRMINGSKMPFLSGNKYLAVVMPQNIGRAGSTPAILLRSRIGCA